MRKFIKEFKQFAVKGNVIDLAVGIIIGGAFQKIVSSMVNDIAMPSLTPALGVVEFKEIHLGPLAIGSFISATLDFIIIALFVFLFVKGINSLRKKSPETQSLDRQEELLTEIRDLLKEKK